MQDSELDTGLTRAQERALELHLRQRWGEVLTVAERGELAAARPQDLQAGVEQIEAALHAAYAAARPAPGLAQRVLAALPAAAAAPGRASEPRASASGLSAAPSRSRLGAAAARRTGQRNWRLGLAIAGVAALAMVVLGGALTWRAIAPRPLPTAAVSVAKGVLVDAQGRPVQVLEAGQIYRVSGSEEVVLKAPQGALLRVLRDAEVGLAGDPGAEAVRLHGGSLYAAGPPDGTVAVACSAFQTEIAGVSLVLQEGGGEADELRQGLVLVFRGSALVRVAVGEEPVAISAGEMYVSGLGDEPVEVFLEEAAGRAAQAAAVAPDAGGLHLQRKQYAEAVQQYRQKLAAFKTQLAAARNPVQVAELRDRQARVRQLLEAHQRRLQTIPDAEAGETPAQRARRIERAAEELRRGQEAYSDPEAWL